jgi:hypothetical protein
MPSSTIGPLPSFREFVLLGRVPVIGLRSASSTDRRLLAALGTPWTLLAAAGLFVTIGGRWVWMLAMTKGRRGPVAARRKRIVGALNALAYLQGE